MSRPEHDSDRLESWKEIATYLNRSVRTVRRWERDEGLPVHRHMHQSAGTVYAYRSEIEEWKAERTESAPPKKRCGLSLPAVPGRSQSIAVLPFDYIGPVGDQSFIADGFTEEVISRLSRVRSLRVISRTSSMIYRGTNRSARSIGEELDVEFLIEGTVRQAGERLRVSAALVEASRDDRRWVETWDGSIDDLFDMQERLARKIADSLPVRLTAEEQSSLGGRSVDDVVAWECLVLARQDSLRWRRDAVDRAVSRLEKALGIVGANAELYAALGRAHLQYREAGIDLTDGPLRLAKQLAHRAFEIDARSPAGLQLRGWVHYSHGEIEDAVGDLAAALDLDWSNADTLALLSNCLLISGKTDEARPLIDRLLAIDPLTPLNRCLPGWANALDGKLELATDPYRTMFEMDPGNPMARLFYVYILTLSGRSSEVEELTMTISAEDGSDLPVAMTAILRDALTGKSEEVRERAEKLASHASMSTELFPRMLAQALAMAGHPDAALRWLESAIDRGFINYPFLAHHDPSLVSLRSDPRFGHLLQRVRERWETFRIPESLRNH